MALEKRLPSSVIVVASRRRTPRLTPSDPIDVQIVSVLVPAEVMDIGFGGFSVETRCSLRIGATYQFRFNMGDGRTIEIRANVVHCRRKATGDWTERYITGCEFVNDPDVPTEMLIDALVDSTTQPFSLQR